MTRAARVELARGVVVRALQADLARLARGTLRGPYARTLWRLVDLVWAVHQGEIGPERGLVAAESAALRAQAWAYGRGRGAQRARRLAG